METFKQPIEFLSKEFDTEANTFVEKPVIKNATFKEYSRTDKTQHKLHFKIISIFKSGDQNEDGSAGEAEIDTDHMYDLTVKFIKLMLREDDEFTVQDKNAFLADSGAIFTFGLWLMKEKTTPFFQNFMNVS